jgi:hypothetical protein
MMERLSQMRDLPDPDQAEAARLLASLPPVAPGEIAERRVLGRLDHEAGEVEVRQASFRLDPVENRGDAGVEDVEEVHGSRSR